ncbi:hypothetical protein HGRIS_007710 [Hohenbuehelia grisea]|uniref:protein-tyrosine-phosphatase n=1 Tax=Hohenbuehelia grisea TaxID=104357 RepID=A0ABR3J5N3_9AGAR
MPSTLPPQPVETSTMQQAQPQRQRKRPPSFLRIDTPAHNPHIAQIVQDSSNNSSALDSAASDSDYSSPFTTMPRRNLNKLALTLPSARSSSNSLLDDQLAAQSSDQAPPPRPRRPSVISLPATTSAATALLSRREEEEGSPAVPYTDGPIQIIPGIWLGSEDNARDWKRLLELGIKSILNVAKEVSSPFDSATATTPRPLRNFASTPNLNAQRDDAQATYYPPHVSSGRPGMHYLKLQWSHGQQNLVDEGFLAGMAFTDAALQRGEGVLIHCQCGISRSATMVIALVMRAAAESSPSVPPEIWALKGMQGAYSFVKEKSKWVGPNMSLIYQLLEYERKLKGSDLSPTSSDRSSALADEEAEWGRQRRLLDEADDEEDERESNLVAAEARALDKAMEDRMVARKSSTSSLASITSFNGNGVGMGQAWRSRYAVSRKRTGSVASVHTNGSLLSEELVEEDEEQELLGVGGGFDVDRPSFSNTESERSSTNSATTSPDEDADYPNGDVLFTPSTARPPMPLASAPAWKTSFKLPPVPATAIRATFNLSTTPKASKPRRRPPPIGVLPPVPSSPITIISNDSTASDAVSGSSSSKAESTADSDLSGTTPAASISIAATESTLTSEPVRAVPHRMRTKSRKPLPPPLHLRHSTPPQSVNSAQARVPQHPHTQMGSQPQTPSRPGLFRSQSSLATPSQTLFVFPPSPTLNTRTPSTLTLTMTDKASTTSGPIPFPSLSTPRVETFRGKHGRTRSFIGLGAPPTPTTACSRVDVRGWVGLE